MNVEKIANEIEANVSEMRMLKRTSGVTTEDELKTDKRVGGDQKFH